jgi:hypothetical protein
MIDVIIWTCVGIFWVYVIYSAFWAKGDEE